MAKKEQKVYMPLMVGDWLKGTRGMRAEVRGVYLSLLLYQWDNGFIPSDIEELCLIDPELPKVWVTLKSKFQTDGPGRLINKKNQEVREFFSKQRSNGKLGGRKRKTGNPDDNPNRNPKSNLHNDLDIDIDNESLIVSKGGPGEFPVILPFESENFKAIWSTWKHYRVEIKKPYHTFSGEQAALERLSKHPEEVAIAMLKLAMSNNWKDFYKPDENGSTKNQPTSPTGGGFGNL